MVLLIKKRFNIWFLCCAFSTFGMYLILGWKPLCLLFANYLNVYMFLSNTRGVY